MPSNSLVIYHILTMITANSLWIFVYKLFFLTAFILVLLIFPCQTMRCTTSLLQQGGGGTNAWIPHDITRHPYQIQGRGTNTGQYHHCKHMWTAIVDSLCPIFPLCGRHLRALKLSCESPAQQVDSSEFLS